MEQDISKIVKDSYELLHSKAEFKFTPPMIIMLKGNIFANDVMVEEKGKFRYQTPTEMIDTLNASKDVTELTHFYLNQCDQKLGTYDPRDIENNLQKLNLM